MTAEGLTESRAEGILRRELGGNWEISTELGTTRATRLARQGARAVAVKLIPTPAAIMSRLSYLGVTPAVITLGDDAGLPYMIQEAVEGPHPDHSWFLANRAAWAAMVDRYLNDPELAALLAAQRGFWRLDVASALTMIERDLERASGRTPALQSTDFGSALDRWRRQAQAVASLPMRPIHPDAHWHNYVIADGRPLLLDWDHVDLSDPLRDVGSQIWGFLPQQYWRDFLRRVGLPVEGDDWSESVCWWAGFKLLSNALFNDGQHDPDGAQFHVGLFLIAADQRPGLLPDRP